MSKIKLLPCPFCGGEAGQSCNEADDICGVEAIEYAIGIVDKGGIE